jgi:hypothetical protein
MSKKNRVSYRASTITAATNRLRRLADKIAHLDGGANIASALDSVISELDAGLMNGPTTAYQVNRIDGNGEQFRVGEVILDVSVGTLKQKARRSLAENLATNLDIEADNTVSIA